MKLDVNGPLPDVTPAQLVAVAGAIITMIVAFGVPISAGERDAITNLATVFFPVLLGADALIRHGRSRALLAVPHPIVDEAPAAVPPTPRDGIDSLDGAASNGSSNGSSRQRTALADMVV